MLRADTTAGEHGFWFSPHVLALEMDGYESKHVCASAPATQRGELIPSSIPLKTPPITSRHSRLSIHSRIHCRQPPPRALGHSSLLRHRHSLHTI